MQRGPEERQVCYEERRVYQTLIEKILRLAFCLKINYCYQIDVVLAEAQNIVTTLNYKRLLLRKLGFLIRQLNA